MLATISPSYDNYEETISTLRYADQAKKIVNHAVINEDEPGTIIRDLRNEIDKLRKELADAKVEILEERLRKTSFFIFQAEKSAEKLNAEIKENEKLMQTITKDWEERIAETDKISKVKIY
jgi:transcription antitermination factor NusA-like protein